MFNRVSKSLLALFAIAGTTVTAHASNLVVNGDFEDGLTGWTLSGPGITNDAVVTPATDEIEF